MCLRFRLCVSTRIRRTVLSCMGVLVDRACCGTLHLYVEAACYLCDLLVGTSARPVRLYASFRDVLHDVLRVVLYSLQHLVACVDQP